MATTLNGSPILNRNSDVPIWIPGPHSATQLEGYANTDVADVLMGMRYMQNADIRHITQLDAFRDEQFNKDLIKRGSKPSLRSNHLAAQADDANWSRNPFKPVRNRFLRQPHSFTRKEQRTRRNHRYIARGDDGIPVVRFGSDFGDDMHNEIAYGHKSARAVPDYRLRQAADRMRAVVVVFRSHEDIARVQKIIGVKPDCIFGDNTVKTLRAWQARNGLKATGWWTPGSEEVSQERPGEPKSVFAKEGQDSPALNEVVQELVGATVDGKYGTRTAGMVGRKQTEMGATFDGVFGPNTARAILADAGTLRVGSEGPAVKLVQYIVGIDRTGVYDEWTADKVKAAQSWAGIETDGVFGRDSRNKLIK